MGLAAAPLLFVYNADSGLFNTLADIGHKLFSPETYPCQLCAISHGLLREREEWRRFVQALGVPCEFLHRDQFRQRFPGCAEPLPAVFRLVQGRLLVCAGAAEIARCAGIAELAALLRGGCMADDATGNSQGRSG